MTTKKERRELSKPDAFQRQMQEKFYELSERPTLIISFIGLIAFLLLSYWGMNAYKNYQLENRTTEISKIDIAYKDIKKSLSPKLTKLLESEEQAQVKIAQLKSQKAQGYSHKY